jgi:predicted RNase H-like HicB family nuclease
MVSARMEEPMARHVKVIVEKHPDGYVAYPLGVRGVVVGQGDTYDEVLQDIRSAIRFHVETFGTGVLLEAQEDVLEAFVAEAAVPVE